MAKTAQNSLLLTLLVLMCGVIRIPGALAQEGPFDLTCELPFASIAPEAPGNGIDGQCGPEGLASKPESRLQNKAKNNLCASGAPVRMTRFSFIQLQRAVDNADIEYGSANKLPEDRTVLRDLRTTSDGHTIGEGSVVQFAAFVLDAHYSNVSKGESVNCKITGQENNDIHVAMSEQANTKDLCESITVEIIPHFRPASLDA